MKIRLTLFGLLAAGILLACAMANNLPVAAPTETPTATPSPTASATPTATPTLTPTPTPLPAVRIESGEKELFNGDWEAAQSEFSTARQSSDDPEIQFAATLGLARTQLEDGKSLEASKTLEALIAAYPDSHRLSDAYFTLARAYETLERYGQAAEAYYLYLALRPGVIDGYVYDRRADMLFSAGDYAGAVLDYQAALRSPGLVDEVQIEMKMARAYGLAGDYTNALALYDDIYARTTNENTRALIDLRKGQLYTSLGQIDDAHAAYQDAVYNYPTAYESYSALVALVEAGVPVDELTRGMVDFFAGEYGVASAAFDRYLQANPEDPATARYYYGLSLRASGGYAGAVAEWDKVIAGFPDHYLWDEAWEQKAYTQWFYLNQYSVAIETLLGFVESAPTHPRAAEFLFDAAQVADRFDRLDQAVELYDRVAAEYPNDERALRAVFLAAITRYRMEDFAGAHGTFEHYLGLSTSLYERAAALMWMGKSLSAQGDTEGAMAAWEQAASADPTGYYSERAKDLLMGRAPFTPPQAYDLAFDLTAERSRADAWMRATFALSADADLSGPGVLADNAEFIRGKEFWNLGLYPEARAEFEALRVSVQNDPVLTYRLANTLYDLGLYRSAIFGARQVLELAGMDDAATMTAPPYFNHIRFGPYYADLIVPMAQEYGFHPLFAFSVVRQESLFEGFIRSPAAATGLMQIMPATGSEIAANLGWPDYSQNDLTRPLVSISFGLDYLDTQRSSFDGDFFAMLAAYNGGPGNAYEWQRLAPDDPDLFLEVVRYEETRTYIRRIYEIFSIYRRLYDRSP